MKKTIIAFLLLTTSFTMIGEVSRRGCSGSKSCSVCKNCKYCKHCAKNGGTCGVCK